MADTDNLSLLGAERLVAGYQKKEVVRDVSLNLSRGEILSVVGPNGAGKSTLLKSLAGFLVPRSGFIYLNGVDVSKHPPYWRSRAGMGYFLQGGRVFGSLTVAENLGLSVRSFSKSARTSATEFMLAVFPQLMGLLERRAGLLSGGERQVLALAMTIMRNPPILLLDEPSAGLSPRLAEEMFARISYLNARSDVAMLLVEQNMRYALSLASRAILLVAGQIALQTGDPKSWLAEGTLEPYFFGAKDKHAGPVTEP